MCASSMFPWWVHRPHRPHGVGINLQCVFVLQRTVALLTPPVFNNRLLMIVDF